MIHSRAMRKTAIILLSFVIVAAMSLTDLQFLYAASAEPIGYVVVSIEKETLGQGFILEPTRVPLYKNENVAQVTDRALSMAGRKYKNTGKLTGGFYLSQIEDKNRGTIDPPQDILKLISKLKERNGAYPYSTEDIRYPDYLGEFDYTSQSGWMYSVNNYFPDVGSAEATAYDGDVVRWQFTLAGLGADLGGGVGDNIVRMNRSSLYDALAGIRAKPELLKDPKIKAAYDECLSKAEKINLTKADIDMAMGTLKKAMGANVITAISLPQGQETSRVVKYGTRILQNGAGNTVSMNSGTETEFPFAEAIIDNKSKANILSWTCDKGYDRYKAGEYVFTPDIPNKYVAGDGEKLPEFKITVMPRGDIDLDGKADSDDLNYLISVLTGTAAQPARYKGRDVNDDGTVDLKDISIVGHEVNALKDKKIEQDPWLTVELDKDRYNAGDTATATVKAYNCNADTLGMAFSYDTSEMRCDSFTWADGIKTLGTDTADGLVQAAGYCTADHLISAGSSGSAVAVVRFTVNKAESPALSLTKGTKSPMNGSAAALYDDGEVIADGSNTEIIYPGKLKTARQEAETRIYSTDLDLYRQAEQTNIRKAQVLAEKKIQASPTVKGVNKAASDYEKTVNGEKTKHQYEREEAFQGADFVLDKTSYIFSGTAVTPTVTGRASNGTLLREGIDYKVSFSDNINTGTATVTITGTGEYDGIKTLNFTITPKQAAVSKPVTGSNAAADSSKTYKAISVRRVKTLKVKAANRKMMLKWTRVKSAAGYQIVIAKNKKFTRAKKIVNARTYKKTVTRLAKKTRYYVKVRAYKKVNGKVCYGAFSTVKTVHIK